MTPERRAFINSLLEHYHPSDTQDVQEMLKDLLGDTLQGMLEVDALHFHVREDNRIPSRVNTPLLAAFRRKKLGLDTP